LFLLLGSDPYPSEIEAVGIPAGLDRNNITFQVTLRVKLTGLIRSSTG
jgi:hypothetical protein